MKSLSALLLINLLSINISFAGDAHPYYGKQFYETFPDLSHDTSEKINPRLDFSKLSEQETKDLLFKILSSSHKIVKGGFDEISKQCQGSGCYRHKQYSYKQARSYMMGDLYLEGNSSKTYSLETYYCLKVVTNKDLGQRGPLGPGKIPNHNIVNAEHMWPQSRFSKKHSKSLQKSDLHALRPVRSNVNSSRGNLPFGEVDKLTKSHCPETGSGTGKIDGLTGDYFEPPDVHKGNVARALFYFAIRYRMNIDPIQESFLKQWHKDDPVDELEMELHEEVYGFQRNRNPFIDHPELLDKLSDI